VVESKVSSEVDIDRCGVWEAPELPFAKRPIAITEIEITKPLRVKMRRLGKSTSPDPSATLAAAVARHYGNRVGEPDTSGAVQLPGAVQPEAAIAPPD
jgi:hypothetical protein